MKKPLLNERLQQIFESHLKTSKNHLDAIDSFLSYVNTHFGVKFTKSQIYHVWYNQYRTVKPSRTVKASGTVTPEQNSTILNGKTVGETKQTIQEILQTHDVFYKLPDGQRLQICG